MTQSARRFAKVTFITYKYELRYDRHIMKNRRKKMDLLVTPLIGVIFFFLFTSFLGFYNSVKPPSIISTITPESIGLYYEEISFQTQDDLTLKGWFVPKNGNETKKAIILLHGYPADKGNILTSLSFLSKDFNLLFFDFRYLGESEGKYSTGGAKEVLDLLAAISYLENRGIEEVGVWGFSMGGAVALMGQQKSQNIKAVISEAAYANLGDLVYQLYRIPYLRTPLAYLTVLWGRVILDINAYDVSPEMSVQKSSIPMLIIHSKNDEVIPFENALRLKEALNQNQYAEFWFEEDLMHGAFGKGYQERVGNFFSRHL